MQSLQMTRSVSTHSLPDTYGKSSQQKISRDALPRAVWSMALKTGTLIIGCEKGSVEVMVINYLSRVKVKKKRNFHEKLRGVFQTIVLLKQL